MAILVGPLLLGVAVSESGAIVATFFMCLLFTEPHVDVVLSPVEIAPILQHHVRSKRVPPRA